MKNAVALESVAGMALDSARPAPGHAAGGSSPNLLDKHYLRKHGKDAYYGQN